MADFGTKLFLVQLCARVAVEAKALIDEEDLSEEQCLVKAHQWCESAFYSRLQERLLAEEGGNPDKDAANADADNAVAYLLVFLARRRARGA